MVDTLQREKNEVSQKVKPTFTTIYRTLTPRFFFTFLVKQNLFKKKLKRDVRKKRMTERKEKRERWGSKKEEREREMPV